MPTESTTPFVDWLRYEQHRLNMVLTERRSLAPQHQRRLDALAASITRAIGLYEADTHPDEAI